MLGKLKNIIMRSIRRDSKWHQGEFKPKFPDKCLNIKMGKMPIIYRSSWEKRFFNYCDSNNNVLKWGSEIFSISYIYDMDKKKHTYYPDVYCEAIDKTGKVVKYLIEIKPENQVCSPKPPKNKTQKSMKNFNYRMMEYIKNQNKWKYAKMFCEVRNLKFKVMTEQNLF